MNHQFLHVTKAKYVGGYRIWLAFNDGTEGEADLQDSLEGEIFETLKQPTLFSRFLIEGGTLTWPNGADFAPEYLQSLTGAPVLRDKPATSSQLKANS